MPQSPDATTTKTTKPLNGHSPPPPPATRESTPSTARYRALKAEALIKTAEQLARRIHERFPTAGLAAVSDELHMVAQEALQTCKRIRRPHYMIRATVCVLLGCLLGVLGGIGLRVNWLANRELFELEHFVQTLEAGLGSIFFISAIIAFLMTLERRAKRSRLLEAMRELRALAHIVDMHQLTKDPESILHHAPTASSPERTLSTFLLGRYLDYCSELLSVINKIGAIYVQEFPDPDALEAADQLANLTLSLSRNVWQKIMILDRAIDSTQVGCNNEHLARSPAGR